MMVQACIRQNGRRRRLYYAP